jgi:hypothetical protein
MHDHLWLGVDRKLEEALRSYEEMGRSLQTSPPGTPMYAAQLATDTLPDNRWQDSFYAHVGTFLAKVRSVPSIIEACFGADRGHWRMRKWLDSLPPDELLRREDFSRQLAADQKTFRAHHLTNERDISEHRLGFPNIEGKVVGPFGTAHTASPTNRIPTAEIRPLEPNINNDPALMWAATLPPRPVRPHWEQFTIGGKPLFKECRAYLTLAEQLVDQARCISQRVHGTDILTTPPSS